MPLLSGADLFFCRDKNKNEEAERRLTRRRARIGEAQAPVCIPRKLGHRDDSNHAGTERSRAARVLPGAFSRVEPLRSIHAVQSGAAKLAAWTALLEIRQENIFVRCAREIRSVADLNVCSLLLAASCCSFSSCVFRRDA